MRVNDISYWGMSTSIDLKGCNPDFIRSEEKMKEFLIGIVKEIDMKAFGEPIVVRFGDNPDVTGFSIAQLIETSLISGHFAEKTETAYIDIFSCKEYDPAKAVTYCKKFFGAEEAVHHTTLRGEGIN